MKNDFNSMLLKEHESKNSAFLDRAQREKSTQGFRQTIDLSVARSIDNPLEISFPFRSVFIEGATDPGCFLFLKPSNREDMQKPFKMGLKDSWSMDYQLPRCFLHWDQQIGKKIDIVFFADSEFRSGSQISVTSGGVSVSDGFQFDQTNIAEVLNTPKQLLPQNLSRKVAYLHNKGNDTIFLLKPGEAINQNNFEIESGGVFEWRNSAELWAFSTDDLNVKIIEMV